VPDTTSIAIKLTWTDKSSNETGFEIYRKSGACSSTSTWTKVATLGSNKSTWTDTGCTSGNTYAYSLWAYTKSGSILSAYGYSMLSVCASAKSGSSDELNITGTWKVQETVHAEDCEGGTYVDTYYVDIVQTGNKLVVTSDVGAHNGTIAGNKVTWMTGRSWYEDGGYVTVTGEDLKVSADGKSMTGSAEWTWTDGEYTCSGDSDVKTTKQ
jgi:hypothetical protein